VVKKYKHERKYLKEKVVNPLLLTGWQAVIVTAPEAEEDVQIALAWGTAKRTI
jgi:hypothetical protein